MKAKASLRTQTPMGLLYWIEWSERFRLMTRIERASLWRQFSTRERWMMAMLVSNPGLRVEA